ncbi:MAG: TIGR04282 family arsenosugar biosynthesis glycosyltransferase [Proteobacteria bacterium]|nr:TIGR04282 family arsenosugar biosynthesis glycosyltransferase [Pseudomonadota bacterium]MBU1708528.1 TIGR04282 family arsenosugar biosynthesis glycosyltransferase [Pseudomonadota bacterium]
MKEIIRQKLIIFTRYPEPGNTKTRLIPALGPDGAADFQKRMTESIFQEIKQVVVRQGVEVDVYYEGGDDNSMRQWLGPEVSYFPQRGGDIGERMNHAFHEAFDSGAEQVVIIGTDCPSLTDEIVSNAFDKLESHDLVLGPALDGGYYLIGLNRPINKLFEGISWGSGIVREQTKSIAKNLWLQVYEVDILVDIDRPEDIIYFQTS